MALIDIMHYRKAVRALEKSGKDGVNPRDIACAIVDLCKAQDLNTGYRRQALSLGSLYGREFAGLLKNDQHLLMSTLAGLFSESSRYYHVHKEDIATEIIKSMVASGNLTASLDNANMKLLFRYVSTSNSPAAVELAKELVVKSVSIPDLQDQIADVVTGWNFIEHTSSKEILKTLKRIADDISIGGVDLFNRMFDSEVFSYAGTKIVEPERPANTVAGKTFKKSYFYISLDALDAYKIDGGELPENPDKGKSYTVAAGITTSTGRQEIFSSVSGMLDFLNGKEILPQKVNPETVGLKQSRTSLSR